MSKLTYIRCGDYDIPNLKLSEQPETSIGKYGRMRKSYLKEHRPILYNQLLMSEKLYPHLLEIDWTAQERVDTMLPHMMEAAGVTEELKACDPMRWVGLMNTLTAQMPLILIFGQIRGAYLGGSILAFFLGYSMLFFKGGILASIYPFSAALILVGFDMSGYAGTTTAPNPLLAVIGVGIMVLWAVLLLLMSSNKKEIKSRKQANSKGKGKRAVRRKGR